MEATLKRLIDRELDRECNSVRIFERMTQVLRDEGIEESKVRTEVRKTCGVSKQAIYNWTQVDREMSLRPVLLFAIDKDVDVIWLATGIETDE